MFHHCHRSGDKPEITPLPEGAFAVVSTGGIDRVQGLNMSASTVKRLRSLVSLGFGLPISRKPRLGYGLVSASTLMFEEVLLEEAAAPAPQVHPFPVRERNPKAHKKNKEHNQPNQPKSFLEMKRALKECEFRGVRVYQGTWVKPPLEQRIEIMGLRQENGSRDSTGNSKLAARLARTPSWGTLTGLGISRETPPFFSQPSRWRNLCDVVRAECQVTSDDQMINR